MGKFGIRRKNWKNENESEKKCKKRKCRKLKKKLWIKQKNEKKT